MRARRMSARQSEASPPHVAKIGAGKGMCPSPVSADFGPWRLTRTRLWLRSTHANAIRRSRGCASGEQRAFRPSFAPCVRRCMPRSWRCPRLFAGGFVNRARDLARGRVGAAFWLEGAGVAVLLSREEDERAVLCRALAWLGERAVIFLQLFAAGADIEVVFGVKDKVAARKRSVRALGLVRRATGSLPNTHRRPRSLHVSRAACPPAGRAPRGARALRPAARRSPGVFEPSASRSRGLPAAP